ncbi:MAG: penicillin-insensitive murein endopeptidase [Bdellovibrionales bacterium]
MQRQLIILFSIVMILGPGCAKPKGSHEHTFADKTAEPPALPKPQDQGAGGGDSETDEDPQEVAPLMFKDEAESALSTYEVPEAVRTQLPVLGAIQKPSQAFRVIKQNLIINAKTSTMKFFGVLQITGQPDEVIELGCSFDKAKSWVCDNMFPLKKADREKRRMQATVSCLDRFRCREVGVRLYVLVNGKIESQLMQSTSFEMRRASSGDLDEEAPVESAKPRVFEKPTQPDVRREVIKEEQLADLVKDSNAAIEYNSPVPVPKPDIKSPFAIPGLRIEPEAESNVPNQAIGLHYRGHLEAPKELPRQGSGFIRRERQDRGFGTNFAVDLLMGASAHVHQAKPQAPPVVIADLAKKTGGRLCNSKNNCHKSHQTGLDVDVVFPARRPVKGTEMWAACRRSGGGCNRGSEINDNLDTERLLSFAEQLVCAQDKSPVLAIFIDTQIKEHLCEYVRKTRPQDLSDPSSCTFKALNSMKYSPGHHNHFHVRFRCPGNQDCQDATVSLGSDTGC